MRRLKTLEEIHGSWYFSNLNCNKGFWPVMGIGEDVVFHSGWLLHGKNYGDNEHSGQKGVEFSMDDLDFCQNDRINTPHRTKSKRYISSSRFTTKWRQRETAQKSVNYLGHILSEKGVHVDPVKVQFNFRYRNPKRRAITTKISRHGHVYSQVHKNLSEVTSPLRKCLAKESEWFWKHEQQMAYQRS